MRRPQITEHPRARSASAAAGRLEFRKAHGAGNDFILISGPFMAAGLPALARELCAGGPASAPTASCSARRRQPASRPTTSGASTPTAPRRPCDQHAAGSRPAGPRHPAPQPRQLRGDPVRQRAALRGPQRGSRPRSCVKPSPGRDTMRHCRSPTSRAGARDRASREGRPPVAPAPRHTHVPPADRP